MIKKDKYFFRVDDDLTPLFLYRLKVGFIAQEWYEGKWQHSDELLVFLRDGYVDLDETSIEEAKKFRPEAFEQE
jgi:hypothetical protein